MIMSRKSIAPASATVSEILSGIRNNTYYVNSCATALPVAGFQFVTVDISAAADFNTNLRYKLQRAYIPTSKRGNLRVYRGQTVEAICVGFTINGRVKFYIRAIANA